MIGLSINQNRGRNKDTKRKNIKERRSLTRKRESK